MKILVIKRNGTRIRRIPFLQTGSLSETGPKRKEKNMKAEEIVSFKTICIVTGKYVQMLNAQRNLQEIVVSKS